MSENRIPLLVLGDDPALPTGLGRICRDLCAVAMKFSERIELAVLGCGANEDRKDGHYPVFRMLPLESSCGEQDMQRLEKVFFNSRKPILWPTWDATRSLWMKRVGIKWVQEPTCWGYFPFDSYGPHGQQPACVTRILEKFEHLAVPSEFARQSLPSIEVDVIPHGYDPKVFYPRNAVAGREIIKVPTGIKHVVGVVATNQARKDWGMVAEVCGMLAIAFDSIHFWFHTDSLDRCWNMALLIHEFGLKQKVTITYNAPDQAMAQMYSACDLTIAPGLGEGFGYPILESIACGTPVVHGLYGAGAEIIQNGGGQCIPMQAERWEATSFPVARPVYFAQDWFNKCKDLLANPRDREDIAATVQNYQWDNLRPRWEEWIERGIEKHVQATAARDVHA